ncbi:opacity protein-like surface antigen [Bradyrhizobium sp. USDA 3315]
MKNLLILTASIGALSAAAPAFGADFAAQPVNIKAPPPTIVATINDWTGYYIGLNGGWGSSHNCWDFNGVTPEGCHNSTGGTIGGQIGYRWQIFNTVYGIEGQGNWADFSGSNVSTAFPADIIGTKTDAFGLLTGHIGYAFNAVLLYAKGGRCGDKQYLSHQLCGQWGPDCQKQRRALGRHARRRYRSQPHAKLVRRRRV